VGVLRNLAAHAGEYVNLPATETAALCDRVGKAAERAVKAGGTAPCAVSFACANGELSVTIGAETVRQSVPA
jgi:hypothetical protein